ncbi:hypothetical protein COCVIDRAFT_12039 [Bipolaris victoriae FI3]|uniref:Uncharacterized protein n=1 Tax=Bipolaris victoriae (strain FI3) TaxID=930091 RepID=W7EXJ9_BIPV3|nr:hypothetical protein COCVIDRAFT_12039 [Bipolaris victoriae FI3]
MFHSLSTDSAATLLPSSVAKAMPMPMPMPMLAGQRPFAVRIPLGLLDWPATAAEPASNRRESPVRRRARPRASCAPAWRTQTGDHTVRHRTDHLPTHRHTHRLRHTTRQTGDMHIAVAPSPGLLCLLLWLATIHGARSLRRLIGIALLSRRLAIESGSPGKLLPWACIRRTSSASRKPRPSTPVFHPRPVPENRLDP